MTRANRVLHAATLDWRKQSPWPRLLSRQLCHCPRLAAEDPLRITESHANHGASCESVVGALIARGPSIDSGPPKITRTQINSRPTRNCEKRRSPPARFRHREAFATSIQDCPVMSNVLDFTLTCEAFLSIGASSGSIHTFCRGISDTLNLVRISRPGARISQPFRAPDRATAQANAVRFLRP